MKATTLKNGQEIFVAESSNGKTIIVSIESNKSITGYKKVISVLKESGVAEIIETIEGWGIDGINMPMLIDYSKIADYKAAILSLYNEIANAILNLNKVEEVIEVETSIEKKKAAAEAVKEETGAVKVFVDYRYDNRIIPFYSEDQAVFFQNLLDTNSSTFDDIIKKDICTKENVTLSCEELKDTYFAIIYNNND